MKNGTNAIKQNKGLRIVQRKKNKKKKNISRFVVKFTPKFVIPDPLSPSFPSPFFHRTMNFSQFEIIQPFNQAEKTTKKKGSNSDPATIFRLPISVRYVLRSFQHVIENLCLDESRAERCCPGPSFTDVGVRVTYHPRLCSAG